MADSKKKTAETMNALLGAAPRPPARTARPPAPAVEEQPVPSTVPRPRKKPQPPVEQPEVEQDGKLPATQGRLPAELFERARTAKEAAGATWEVWFLDAFDAVYDELGEHYQPAPERRSRVPVRRRRTRRPTGEPLVSLPLRLEADEVAVLDERIAELLPPSKADFITTIIRLRLAQLGLVTLEAAGATGHQTGE